MQRQAPLQTKAVVAHNLRLGRERVGLTQRQLGEAVGVESFQISRWERGSHRPSDTKLHALGEALGMTFAEFFAEPEEAAA